MAWDETDALVTRAGLRVFLRPVTTRDEPILRDFFAHVTPEDLHFRFLSAVRDPAHDRLMDLVALEDGRDSYLAFNERGEAVATATLARMANRSSAEVAIAIRGDHRDRGLGWTLLDYLVGRAGERGYHSIESIEHRDNHAAVDLECRMGFSTQPVEGDPALVRVSRTL